MFHSEVKGYVTCLENILLLTICVGKKKIVRKVVRDERHEAQHGAADPDVLGGGAHPGPVLRPRHPPQPLHRPRPRHGGQGR